MTYDESYAHTQTQNSNPRRITSHIEVLTLVFLSKSERPVLSITSGTLTAFPHLEAALSGITILYSDISCDTTSRDPAGILTRLSWKRPELRAQLPKALHGRSDVKSSVLENISFSLVTLSSLVLSWITCDWRTPILWSIFSREVSPSAGCWCKSSWISNSAPALLLSEQMATELRSEMIQILWTIRRKLTPQLFLVVLSRSVLCWSGSGVENLWPILARNVSQDSPGQFKEVGSFGAHF